MMCEAPKIFLYSKDIQSIISMNINYSSRLYDNKIKTIDQVIL